MEWSGPVVDDFGSLPIRRTSPRFSGGVWDVRSDEVEIADQVVVRDLVVHPGAVGVLALDDDDRVLLIRQYRHPIGGYLFEPPAGLLDHAGEEPLKAAQRELLEEGGFIASQWSVLIDFANTPGGSSETFRCFLARGIEHAEGGRQHTGEAEELDLPQAWVPLERAKDLVFAGQLQNPTTVIGVLAAWAAKQSEWAPLRPADSPWPIRDHVVASGRVTRPRQTP